MIHRWLSLLFIGGLSLGIFALFSIRLRPVVQLNDQGSPTSGTSSSPSLTAPVITFIDPKRGSSQVDAMTLVVFGDFQCAPCKQVATSLDELLPLLPNLRIVWKDLPNASIHPLAIPAAVAARCAGEQEKFWEYHDALYAEQVLLTEQSFLSIAENLSLDSTTFGRCLEKQETLPVVEKGIEEALALRVSGTPALFLGEERLVGEVTTEEILAFVRQVSTQVNP